MKSEIEAASTVDLARLIEEVQHGILSVPLAELPRFVRALLTPALEERQRRVAAEQREIIQHHRELRRSEHVPDWLESKSPTYQKAYEEFFGAVSDSERRLDGALSELNDSERQLGTRLTDIERRAVHLADGRLAFDENGHFVYADGSAVREEDLAACAKAKKDADQKCEPLASWREHSAIKNALADTVELEQKISGVSADVGRTGDEVRRRPPDGEADLRNNTAAIQGKTDDAVALALARYRENDKLLSAPFDIGDANEHSLPDRSNSGVATSSASFNTSSIGNAELSRPPPKPVALSLDQVTSAATDQSRGRSNLSTLNH